MNHMGADINRGILCFTKKKKLGKEGLWWLKVHLANKWGQDKLPLVDRAKFTEALMDVIH